MPLHPWTNTSANRPSTVRCPVVAALMERVNSMEQGCQGVPPATREDQRQKALTDPLTGRLTASGAQRAPGTGKWRAGTGTVAICRWRCWTSTHRGSTTTATRVGDAEDHKRRIGNERQADFNACFGGACRPAPGCPWKPARIVRMERAHWHSGREPPGITCLLASPRVRARGWRSGFERRPGAVSTSAPAGTA